MNSKFNTSFRLIVILWTSLHFTYCARQYSSRDGRSYPQSFEGRSDIGYASWYGDQFHGRKTASGEMYDMYSMTAAHREAPFGTQVRVTNLSNNRQTIVKINDRGPFVRGRIIDLSKKAAQDIGMIGSGTTKVKLEFLNTSPIEMSNLGDIYVQQASFASQSNANDYLNVLNQAIPDLSARIYNENGYFRIRSGPYSSIQDAESMVMRLKKSNFDGLILHSK